MSPTATLDRLFGETSPRTLIAGGALGVLASRLPFLVPGYGMDGDAWLTASAAERIAATGRYAMSRVPGHPLHEFACAVVPQRDPLTLNLLSAVMSVIAFVAFAAAARRLGLRDYLVAALALAFVPVVYLASTTTMDYVWALAFLMLSLCCATRDHPKAAGVLLGAAAGCRLTSILLLAPYVLFLSHTWRRREWLRSAVQFSAGAIVVTAMCYLPVWLTYRSAMPQVYETTVPPLIIFKHITVDTWGLLGSLALVVGCGAAVWQGVRGRGAQRALRNTAEGLATAGSPALIGSLLAVAIVFGLFLRLPHEPGYLIPALPFVILLLGRVAPRRVFLLLCGALIISPFIFGVYTIGRPASPRASPLALVVPGDRALIVDPLVGAILADHAARVTSEAFARRVIDRSLSLPPRSVVATGSQLWWVKATAPQGQAGPDFVWTLTPAQLAERLREGWQVYYVPGTEAHLLAAMQLSPDLEGLAPQALP